MKHSFWKRFLALVMAIAIVLSTGVLDSAGWLLANNGEDTTQEPTGEPTIPPSDQQGGSSTETLDLTTDPTGESTGATDPSEGGETEDETTESTPVKEVTLTVVISAVFADESQEGYVLATEYLTYAEGEASKTIAVSIPGVEGYTFATDVAMTLNAEGKYEASLSRPAESGMLYITVTYSPIAPEGEEGEEPETPAEGEETTEGEEAAALTTTLVVISADMGGVLTFEDAVYTFTWAEEETEKTVSFFVPSLDGYAYLVDSEDYISDGAGTYTGTIARPETSDTYYVDVFYRAVESVQPDEIFPETTPVATFKFYVDETVVDTQIVQNGETVLTPAAPEKNGYKFLGWYDANGNLFAEGAVSVSAVETEPRVYTARFKQVYYVFFLNEEGAVHATKEYFPGESTEAVSTDVTFPVDANEKITGWYTEAALTNKVGATITPTANVTLYPKVEAGFWIYFNTAEDATYIAPQFVYPNKVPAQPANPERPGYNFNGWTADVAGFSFSNVLTSNVTLTANWTTKKDTKYTILYYIENANDNGYTFEGTGTGYGETGTKIEITSASTNVINQSYRQYFHYDGKYEEGVIIKGDGSSVVKVYFARNTYTIRFTISSGNNIYIGTSRYGGYSSVSYNTAPVVTIGGATYTTVYSFTAKYEADISEKWPTATNITTYPRKTSGQDQGTYYLYTIYGNGSSNTSKRINLTADLINDTENNSVTDYTFFWSKSKYEFHLYYLVQPVSGSTDRSQYINLKELEQEVTYSSSASWNQKEIAGFTAAGKEQASESGGNVYFYYNRMKYTITFQNGDLSELTDGIYYEADISGYNYTPTQKPVGIGEGYEFDKWYTDPEFKNEFVWTDAKMPANNMILYGKWVEPEYTGKIHVTMKGDDVPHTITIPYGTKIDEQALNDAYLAEARGNMPEGYVWRGWALKSGTEENPVYTPFNFETVVQNDITLYAYWTSGEEFSVVYNANDGSGTVTDTKKYADGAQADIQKATVTKENEVFLYWNTEADGSGTSYYPGDKMLIEKKAAVNMGTEEAPNYVINLYAIWGPKPVTTSITYYVNGGVAANGNPRTFDEMLANSTQVLKDIGELGFSRPGYKFLGWSRSASATSATYSAGNNIIVGRDGSSNVLYAVWEQQAFGYTVKYVWGEQEIVTTKNGTADFGTDVTESAVTVAGYTLNDSASKTLTMTADVSKNVIVFNYVKDVTFTGDTAEKVYTGSEQSITGITPSGLADGHTYTGLTYAAKGTNVGTYDGAFSGDLKIMNGTEDVTSLYNVTKTPGKLTITKASIALTVTGGSDSVVYNGKEQSIEDISVKGLLDGHSYNGVGYIAKGTNVGTYEGEFTSEIVIWDENDNDVTQNYAITYVPGTLTITASKNWSMTGSGYIGAYDAQEHTISLTPTVTEGTTVSYSLDYGETWTDKRPVITDVAELAVMVKAENPNYTTLTEIATLKVTPAPLTVETPNASKTYDGTALTKGGTITGFVGGETATFTTTGSQTAVGSSPNTYSLVWDGTAKASNYEIKETIGTLTVSEYAEQITVTTTGGTFTYDGLAHDATVTVTGLPTGYTVKTATSDDTATDVTTAPVEANCDTLVIVNAQGEDVTAKLNFKYVDDTIVINPAPLTITTPNANKTYDGSALTAEGEITGFVNGETATFTTTGSQTDVGTSDNTYTLVWDGTAKESNYTITKTIGTLTVTASDEWTLTANGYAGVYDAQPHAATASASVTEGTTIYYKVGEGEWTTTAPTITNVGEVTVQVKAENHNYNTLETTVTLKVTPRPVTFKGESKTVTYNGAEQSITGITPGNLLGGHKYESLSYIAKGTNKGVYDGAFSGNVVIKDADGNDVTANYTPSNVPGKLTIEADSKELVVTITGNTKTVTYTGAEQSVTGFSDDAPATVNVALAAGSEAKASGTNAGTYEMGLTEADFVVTSENYTNITVKVVDGWLTVNPITDEIEVIITGNSDSKVYNKTEQSVTGFTTNITDTTITATLAEGSKAEAKGTNVGEYPMGLTKDDFVVTSQNYSNIKVTVVDGKLTITPITDEIEVIITGNSKTEVYNKTEQSVTGFTTNITDTTITATLAEGSKAEAKGTNVGEYPMGLTKDDFVVTSQNYSNIKVTVVDGKLTITPITEETEIFVIGNTATLPYTGSEQSVTGYTTEISDSTITVALAEGSEAIAKGTNVNKYMMGLTAEDFVATSENYTNIKITVTDGWLQITNAQFAATFTGESKTVTYNGEKHTISVITPSGLLDGHTYTGLTYGAEGTDVGTYKGVFSGEVRIMDGGVDVTENYAITLIPGELVINPVEGKVTVTITENNGAFKYDGIEKTVEGYDVSIDNKLYFEKDFTFGGNDVIKGTDAGSYEMELKPSDFTNISKNFTNVEFVIVDGTLEIAKRVVTLTSATDSKEYDGTALTNDEVTVSGDGFAANEGATYDVTGSQLTVGSSDNTFTYTLTEGTKEGNYDITVKFGTLTVTNRDAKFQITVEANSGSKTYDGQPITVEGFKTLTFTVEGQTYTVEGLTATNTQTTVGTYTVEITGTAVVKDANGNDVTAQFDVTEIDGQLVITPAEITVTITGNTESKVYNGSEQMVEGYEVEISNKLYTEDDFSFSGTDVVKGTNVGTYPMGLAEDQFTNNNDNFTVTFVVADGQLEITPVTDKVTVTITENNGEFVYDSTEKTVSDYDVSIDNELYFEKDFTFSGTDSVSGTNVGKYDMELKPADFTNISKNFANVEFVIVDGALEITKRAIEITAGSDSKEYDGTALVKNSYTNTDPAEGDVLTSVTVTGSITEVGTTANVPSAAIIMDGEEDVTANYAITYTNGTLEITQSTKELVVTANSNTWTYDSETHADGGYTVTYGDETYTVKAGESATLSTGDTVTATITKTVKNVADSGVNEIVTLVVENAEQYAKITEVDGELTITQKEVTITADSNSKEYDGTALTDDGYTIEGLATGDAETSVTVIGSITEVGTTANVPSAAVIMDGEEDVTANYDITYVNGELEITQSTKELVVTANSNTWTYDSEIHADGGYTVTYGDETYTVKAGESATLATGDTVTATITKTVKNVADSGVNEIVTLVVENADQYAKITEVDGELTITQKEVTITADSNAKEYDGTALTDDGYTIEGLATGDAETSVTVTGSITEIGKVDNVPSDAIIMDGEEDVTANYAITYVNGELEITASSKSLVVTANSNTWEYDSEYHADGGYTVTYNGETYTVKAGESATLSTGDTVTATITAQVKNVADTVEGNNVIVELVVENAEQYASIVKVAGTLEITQKAVTITADSNAKEYDGTALTDDGYTSTDLAEGDAYASVTVTGSITEIGKVANVPSAAVIMDGEEDVTANYAITYVNGELEITASSKVLTVTANSNTWTYDSETHADGGYTVTYGDETYTVKAGESATLSTGDTVTATITKTVKNVADSGVNEIVTLVVDNADQYASIVEVDGTLTITQKEVTITADSASREYNGTALTKDSYTSTDLAEGDAYASVTVTGSITEVGTTANVPSAAVIMDGEEDVTANYAITYVNGKLTITAMSDEVLVTITENSGSVMYDGEEHTVNGYVVTSISDPLYTEADFTFSGDATVSGTDAGTYEMELKPTDFTNISANFADVEFVIVDGNLEITKRSVTMTSVTDSKAYDGTALTNSNVTVTGDGFAEGEGASYDVTGSQTEFGTSSNTFTYTLNEGTKADNYIIKTVEGTLTVSASQKTVTVTITENSGSVMYDGEEHTVTGYVVTSISDPLYTEADFTFSGNANVSGTDAGTYEMELSPEDFANISANFADVEFVIVDGQLEITKRTVTMTSATDSKVYDGTALTNDTVTVTDDGFAEGEGASYDVTGTQTVNGTSNNTFTYTLNEGTKADNYIIKTVEGTLTVTAVTDKVIVTITEHSGEATYDGTQHTVTGYDVTSISNPLYTVDDFNFWGNATVSGVDAGAYDMQVAPGYFTNKSPNFANVEFVIVDGQLTINKRAVTLTSASDAKEYDGIALTAKTVEITAGSFAPNEGYTVNITGSQTLVGKSDNTFTYALTQNTKSGNYEITVVFGELEVTDRSEPFVVVVEANSGERVYNGQPFTVSGLKEATVARMAARIDGQTVTFLLNGETYTISGLHAERTETHVNPAAPTDVDVLPYSGYEVAITGTPVITDSEGNDVTKQFTVETISGVLTIHPAPVTMVSGDATKPYDGTELINHEVTVEGFMEGEGASYDVTGTQTLVGSSENALTYTLNEGTQAQDYSIETTFGTLVVTPPEDYEIVDKTHTTETLYRLGDTVTFDITVKNIFSEEAKVVITEQEGVSILWNGEKVQSVETTIPAGETITLQAEYTLQEKDILAGEYTNVVDANIKATVDKIPYEGDDDDDDKVDEIEDPKPQLTLDKVTTSTPANGSKYVVGETVTYQITATNSGNLTLHDVVIYDVLTGESQSKYAVETDPVEYTFELDVNLAPGESATVTYSFTVTEEDLGKNLINAVTGSAGNSSEDDDEEKNDTPTDVIPDEVKDPTDDIRRDLDVEKSVLNYQNPYRIGSYVEYEIVVTNRGNVTERDVIVTDTIDAKGPAKEFSFTDLGGGLLLPGNRVQIPSMAPGESVTILCRYRIVGYDEALPINNTANVESSDGETGDEDDAETVIVEKLYNLTIYYLTDDWQTVLAPEYHGRYSVSYLYYVESPEIEGYTPNYEAIWSGYEGMPEHDVVCYVLYSKLPDETTEPTETTAPTDPSEETTEPTTEPTEPTYDLQEIPEEEVPLGNVDLGDHTCCIMHFLIMLVAMILLGFYTNDRKKYQERIHELKRSLAAEDAAAAAAGEEQA